MKRKNLISAVVVGDSKHYLTGKRISTLIVTLPRIVLAEFNTHRVFSRNSGSSRAIPHKRMVQSVKENLFIPLAFQKDHKGMQGTDYFKTGSFSDKFRIGIWWGASKLAILSSTVLHKFNVTKQVANRILEPFMWHTIVVTSTEWEGFFRQRCPQYLSPLYHDSKIYRSFDELRLNTVDPNVKNILTDYSLTERLGLNKGGAEIHISLAAEAIYEALKKHTPEILQLKDWHIPFKKEILEYNHSVNSVNQKDVVKSSLMNTIDLVQISTALCAMVSFTEVGGKSLFEKINPNANLKLHDKLIDQEHMSPTEHCAQVQAKSNPGDYSNLKGKWLQYRKIVEKKLKQ